MTVGELVEKLRAKPQHWKVYSLPIGVPVEVSEVGIRYETADGELHLPEHVQPSDSAVPVVAIQ